MRTAQKIGRPTLTNYLPYWVAQEDDMSTVDDLQNSISRLFNKSRVHSYATHSDYKHIYNRFAEDLVGLGYKLRDIHGLQQKHIKAIVEKWKSSLKVSTVKNRTSALRALCKKINKPNLMPRSNDALGIEKRSYLPTENIAIYNPDFSKISNPHVYVSLELQRLFGLRREEAIKIKPHLADKGDRLELLPTWCKGGRGRVIPILTEEQRFWVDNAKAMADKFGMSLIPVGARYIQHRRVYDQQVYRAGLRNPHGLRHAYAQRRYKELTGWEAPINGGPKVQQLKRDERRIDHRAKILLSEELGHSRKSISATYIGGNKVQ